MRHPTKLFFAALLVVGLLSLDCNRSPRTSIESLVLQGCTTDSPCSSSAEYVKIERRGGIIQYRKMVAAGQKNKFYEGSGEVSAADFDRIEAELRNAGLRDSATLVIAGHEAKSEPYSFLRVSSESAIAEIKVYRLQLYWTDAIKTLPENSSSVLRIWKELLRGLPIKVTELSDTDVRSLAKDCAADWPRIIQPDIYDRAQTAVGYSVQTDCVSKWRQ